MKQNCTIVFIKTVNYIRFKKGLVQLQWIGAGMPFITGRAMELHFSMDWHKVCQYYNVVLKKTLFLKISYNKIKYLGRTFNKYARCFSLHN